MNEARVLASLAKTVNKQRILWVEVKAAKTVNKPTSEGIVGFSFTICYIAPPGLGELEEITTFFSPKERIFIDSFFPLCVCASVCIVLCVFDVHVCHPPTPSLPTPLYRPELLLPLLSHHQWLSHNILLSLYIYIYILRIGGNITQGTTEREDRFSRVRRQRKQQWRPINRPRRPTPLPFTEEHDTHRAHRAQREKEEREETNKLRSSAGTTRRFDASSFFFSNVLSSISIP